MSIGSDGTEVAILNEAESGGPIGTLVVGEGSFGGNVKEIDIFLSRMSSRKGEGMRERVKAEPRVALRWWLGNLRERESNGKSKSESTRAWREK